MRPMDWIPLALLFVLGVAAGALNVLAGGGSFITLPVLIFYGLPAGVANGTNRIGIVLQNVAAVWSFRRQRVLDWNALAWAALPALPGGVAGTWLALLISDAAFQRVLAFLMVALTLWTLFSRQEAILGNTSTTPERRHLAALAVGFFFAGVYAGFVQAGVGFFFLALTTAAGLDMVRGNAVKVLAMLCVTVLALALFAWNGRVDWELGMALGLGNFAGGFLGARLTVLKGHAWVRRVVIAAVVVFAVKLWMDA